jgi:hypothetical protein
MAGPEHLEKDLFVAYAETDRGWVEHHLIPALEAGGVTILTREGFRLGAPWTDEFEHAVESCRWILLVISASFRADVNQQFVDKIARFDEIEGGEAKVIALLLEDVPLPLGLRMKFGLRAVTSEEKSGAVERLVREIKGVSLRPARRPPCPYPGMVPFQESDANLFKGREREIRELMGEVKASSCVFVLGASGSGKSSLVRAGVVPKWRSREGPVDVIQPGPSPPTRPADLPAGDPSRAHLLVVDQFEEAYTLAAKDASRDFQSALLKWLETPPPAICSWCCGPISTDRSWNPRSSSATRRASTPSRGFAESGSARRSSSRRGRSASPSTPSSSIAWSATPATSRESCRTCKPPWITSGRTSSGIICPSTPMNA